MKNILRTHPIFTLADTLSDICKPLKHLNINYFAHVNVTKEGEFTSLSNNPAFAAHYVANNYQHADIHLAKSTNLGKYVIWDAIDLAGSSRQMDDDARQFGIEHTFTIIEESASGKDFYHFASNTMGKSINQEYLRNLDLLKMFIQKFDNTVKQSSELRAGYDVKLVIDDEQAMFATEHGFVENNKLIRQRFLKEIDGDNLPRQYNLTSRECECLKLYVQGRTAKEISNLLGLSKRSVENYIYNIKVKLSVSTKAELIHLSNHLMLSL